MTLVLKLNLYLFLAVFMWKFVKILFYTCFSNFSLPIYYLTSKRNEFIPYSSSKTIFDTLIYYPLIFKINKLFWDHLSNFSIAVDIGNSRISKVSWYLTKSVTISYYPFPPLNIVLMYYIIPDLTLYISGSDCFCR